MNWIFYIIGSSVIVLAIVDLVWTTLWIDGGAGPLSRRLVEGIWKAFDKAGSKKEKLYDFVGPLTLVGTLLMWSLLIWIGFAIFFTGDPTSISKSSSPNAPIFWYERFYFTGFSLFTLGVGDYTPKEGFWQIVTTLNSAVGILFLTLCASYIISVVDAVVQKRSLATSITSLGKNSSDILAKSWNGHDFNNINLVLVDVASKVSLLTQQHHAYPLLHSYHSRKPEESASVSIAILSDTLTILLDGLEDDNVVNTLLVKSTKESIGTYLESLTQAFVNAADNVPAVPVVSPLRDQNLPLASDERLEEIFIDQAEARKKLLGAVRVDHQEWPNNH